MTKTATASNKNGKDDKWLVPKLLPADQEALSQSLRLARSSQENTSALAPVLSQDPVLVIEILKEANNSAFAGETKTVSTLRPSIIRLGAERVAEILTDISKREEITDPGVHLIFNRHRSRCKRIGGVAQIVSEILAKHLSEECELVGLLCSIGDMLAVYHLGKQYLELAEDSPRATVNYRLVKNHSFDVYKRGIAYLRRSGVPESITSIIDEDIPLPQVEQKTMRLIYRAALELIDAYDNEKWEKLSPDKELPTTSIFRLLKINERQHRAIYEQATQYLHHITALDSGREQLLRQQGSDQDDYSLNEDWFDLDDDDDDEEDWSWFDNEPEPETNNETSEATDNALEDLDADLDFLLTDCEDDSAERSVQTLPRENSSEIETSFVTMHHDALVDSLDTLVNGPFSTAALIAFSEDRKEATILAQRGSSHFETTIMIADTDSPFLRALSQTQVFSTRRDAKSPFGSPSYAISPVQIEKEASVAIYADCGQHPAITLEGRRLFRDTIAQLNEEIKSSLETPQG